jgi:hypothetical protein
MNKETLLDEILNMPEGIQKDIYNFLRSIFVGKEDSFDSHFEEIRESRFNGGFICPHCSSNHVKRIGTK